MTKTVNMQNSDNAPDIDDLFTVFDQMTEFPWLIEHFSELKRYVVTVTNFLPHATAQQKIRLRARINLEPDPVASGEYESELEVLKIDETTILPHLVWGGVLVSVYAAFEYGVESMFRHWQKITAYPTPFKQKSDFLSDAEAYATKHIGIHLFSDPQQHKRLLELKNLRISFVHNGSQLSMLKGKLEEQITSKVHIGLSFDLIDGRWIANAKSAKFYLLSTEKIIRSFGIAMWEKCLSHNKS